MIVRVQKGYFFSLHRRGFTIIEILIAISIAGMLLGIGLLSIRGISQTQTLKSAGQTLKNNLRNLQARAQGEKPAGSKWTASCRNTCVNFDGWGVQMGSTYTSTYPVCDFGTQNPGGGSMTLDNGALRLAYLHCLPGNDIYSGELYNFPNGVTFDVNTQYRSVFFRSVASGMVFTDDSTVLQPNQTSMVVTLQGFNPVKYYSLCITKGGDIKDCGPVNYATCQTNCN